MSTTLRPPKRNGQSLILMLFILIALAGVLALTFDYGYVILSRRQMQTGVNASALEGMRGQGLQTYDQNDQLLRRENARLLLRSNYDDDFDLSGNSTTIGAGIDRSLIQGDGYRSVTIGSGDTSLAEDLANRSSFVYRPNDFELNQDNAVHGDMVSGQYVDSDTARPLGGALHEEFSDYQRMDFRNSDASDYDSSDGDNAFLIRLRRTNNSNGLDEVAGISSGGGGLPLIMGLLGWMSAEPAGAAYSIRRDGVIVRATAIGQANAAAAISSAIPAGLLPGVDEISGSTPFILNSALWNVTGAAITFTIEADGSDMSDQVRLIEMTSLTESISESDTSFAVASDTGFPIGSLPFTIRIGSELLSVTSVSGTTWTVERGVSGTTATGHANDDLVVRHSGKKLGQDVSTWTSNLTASDLELWPGKSAHVYVPLFQSIEGIDRIVAFGFVDWSWDSITNQLTITPQPSIVGPRGVSGSGFASDLSEDDYDGVLTSQALLGDLLLAPVHARAVR